MGQKARRRREVVRAGVFAVAVAMAALAASLVQAQSRSGDNQPALFKADEVTDDRDLGLVVARGNVEVSQGDRILRADVVTYNRQTNIITATGGVSLVEPGGDVMFADYVEVSQDFREAVLQNLRAVLADQSRLAAVSGRRSGGNITTAQRVTYSPCELCKTDPTRAPVWQLKAARVTHDQEARQIIHRDARMEMFGVPIAYTPYLSHPDGSIERASGFLAPTISSSGVLGAGVIVPYYWAIDDDRDATFEPLFLVEENPVAAGEYRQRTARGRLEFNASLTSADRRNDANQRIDGTDIRGHIKGKGRFDIDDDWRWGFDAERSTDDTYLRRYRLMQRYRFLNSNTLTSSAFTEGFRDRHYAAANAYAFQGLRTNDDPGLTPLVLPMLDANYVGDPDSKGGHAFLDANALSIYRTEGTRDQRTSLRGGWTLPYTTSTGEIYQLSVINYLQGYNVSQIGSAADPFRPTDDGTRARYIPQVDFSWRYPFIRHDAQLTTIVEPIASFIAAPNIGDQNRFPNEDSRTIDFDETNLFRPNRFSGLDRLEGGQRVNYGFNTSVRRPSGMRASAFLGQSYRLREESAFPVGSGLEEKTSNYVGRFSVVPHPWFSSAYYFQLNHDDLSANRNRATVSFGPAAANLSASYIYVDRRSQIGLARHIEQLGLAASARVNEHWRFQARQLTSLAQEDEGTLLWGGALIYEDECLLAGLDLTRRYIGNRDNPPDTAAIIRVVFKNLGQIQTAFF